MNGRRTVRTVEKDDAFFDALSNGAPVGDAAAAVGYARRSVYEWREAEPDFAARWETAINNAIERMEKEADRRGIDGTLRPVFYQGVECGQMREYSDTLLIFRLKALRPDQYRERFEHAINGKIDLGLDREVADDIARIFGLALNARPADEPRGGGAVVSGKAHRGGKARARPA